MSQVAHQRRKRSKYEIVHDILDQCQNGAKKTWVMYRANLSYDLATNYLSELVKRGLIENREGMYYITDKGRQLLEVLKAWKEKRKELDRLMEQVREMLPDLEKREVKEEKEAPAPEAQVPS